MSAVPGRGSMKKNIFCLTILAVILAGCGGFTRKQADDQALGSGVGREEIQDERQMNQLKDAED